LDDIEENLHKPLREARLRGKNRRKRPARARIRAKISCKTAQRLAGSKTFIIWFTFFEKKGLTVNNVYSLS
jgi:hypothetical protein